MKLLPLSIFMSSLKLIENFPYIETFTSKALFQIDVTLLPNSRGSAKYDCIKAV